MSGLKLPFLVEENVHISIITIIYWLLIKHQIYKDCIDKVNIGTSVINHTVFPIALRKLLSRLKILLEGDVNIA